MVKYYLIWSTIFKDSKIRVHTTLETANRYCKMFTDQGFDACVELDKNQFPDTTTGALYNAGNPK
jgi:hypothetical protein